MAKCGVHVVELLASKVRGKQIEAKEWPVENHLGGGGGMVVCNFPTLDLTVAHIHLGLPTKKFFYKQIKHTKTILKKLKGKLILMGDFNEGYDNIKKHFPTLILVTGRVRTCSFTPIIRWFLCKDMDHILVRGLKKRGVGTFFGRSDHKLIWADLESINRK